MPLGAAAFAERRAEICPADNKGKVLAKETRFSVERGAIGPDFATAA